MSVVKNITNRVSNFRLKSLLSYCSEEWMAGQTKKYRTVFDRAELQYIRCELALHNLELGNGVWTLKTTFRCINTTNGLRKEVCVLENSQLVARDTDVVYVRDGWGAEEQGVFWQKGDYTWEVYVEDEKIGDSSFTVNDVGLVRRMDNPYFFIKEIKFYGGDYEGWKQESRTFLEIFSRAKTQYVWAEVTVCSKTNLPWNYELFFNFYDGARQHKGQVVRTGRTEHDQREYNYTFDVGWGNATPGSWKSYQYYFDVVFMDHLIASTSFYIGEDDKAGIPSLTIMID